MKRTHHRSAASSPSMEQLEHRTLMSVSFMTAEGSGTRGFAVQFADINGDGKLDIVGETQRGRYLERGEPFVRFNEGGGRFGEATPLIIPGVANRIWGDFDGDRDFDILANGVFLRNDGENEFVMVTNANVPSGVASKLAFDANGDAATDLVVTTSDGRVRVLLGGLEGFETSFDAPFAGTSAARLQVADLNGDGRTDLVVEGGSVPTLFANDGGGAFHAADSGTLPSGASFTDINGDGRADAWWGGDDARVARLNSGGGVFAPQIVLFQEAGARPGSFIPDLSGDGRPELVVRVESGFAATNSVLLLSGPTLRYAGSGPTVGSYSHPSNTSFSSSVVDFADVTDDGIPDLLRESTIFNPFNGGSSGFGVAITRRDASPTIGAVVFSAGDAEPGAFWIAADGVAAGPNGTIWSVRFFIDSNDNNTLDDADQPIGIATRPDAPGRWSTLAKLPDGTTPGSHRFFAVADDGVPATATSEVWTRVFYPGGRRSDRSLRDEVALHNPTNHEVKFRILASYESGDRDGLLAEGTLAAGASRVIRITNPEATGRNLVREGARYSVVVQTTARIAALFRQVRTRTGTILAEALTAMTDNVWSFPAISRTRSDYLTFYNPGPGTSAVMVRFYDRHDAGNVVERQFSLEAQRRGTLVIRDIAELARSQTWSAQVRSSSEDEQSVNGPPIVVALMSYAGSVARGGAFTELGTPGASRMTARLPLPLISGVQSIVTLSSMPDLAEHHVVLRLRFDGPNAGTIRRRFTVPASGRKTVDVSALVPASATSVLATVTSDGGIVACALGRGASDSAAVAASAVTSTSWALAGLRGSRNAAELETLTLFNPGPDVSKVTLRFTLSDGSKVVRTRQLAPGRMQSISLHHLRFVAAAGGAYGISVDGTNAIIVGVRHQGPSGVWASLGSIIGPTIPLAP